MPMKATINLKFVNKERSITQMINKLTPHTQHKKREMLVKISEPKPLPAKVIIEENAPSSIRKEYTFASCTGTSETSKNDDIYSMKMIEASKNKQNNNRIIKGTVCLTSLSKNQ